MVSSQMQPMRYTGGRLIPAPGETGGREGTIAYRILESHNTSGGHAKLEDKV